MPALVDFCREVWAFADANIDELPWKQSPAHRDGPLAAKSLHHMLVRVIDDLARHAGQADMLRESIDGLVGLNPTYPSLPEDDQIDWPAYVAKLTTSRAPSLN